MVKIELTQGLTALVDDEDSERVLQYKWYPNRNGNSIYALCNLGTWEGHQKQNSMHKLVFPVPEGMLVDHINRNGLDNRKENLRVATKSQNAMNSDKTWGYSKYRGVSWCKRKNKWRVAININQKQKHVGYFVDEREAALAYNAVATKLFGGFAGLNTI